MKELKLFRKMLSESQKTSTYSKVANLFSEGMLEYEGFPDEYLGFLIDLLSNETFYSNSGVFHFLALIGVDTDIMTKEQLKTISDTIIDNFVNYEDDMLCLTACDFIAQYYPYEDAKKILLNIKEIEKGKTEQGYALDGLKTLEFNQQSH
jgi:hypothetical protein